MLAAPRRFYSLDALRGLAALSVVFWHWQHFFHRSTEYGQIYVDQFPLYDFFFPLYLKGWIAVDLFFSLSGFIFYWLYAAQVRAQKVSARDFFVLRFSRLYPLHLLTLLAVAAGQASLLSTTQSYFIYPWNDLYHFLLNVLFIPAWGLQRGDSFNAPVWSVSVEVFLYLAFFIVCRLLPVRALALALLAAAGFFVVQPFLLSIGRGIFSFFIGGCAFLLYEHIVRKNLVQKLAMPLVLLMAGLWVAVAAGIKLQMNVNFGCRFILFPVTILALAVLETKRGSFGARLAFLGDISYSSYLLHFPLQLAFIGMAMALDLQRAFFLSTWVFLLFFAVLLTLSWCSFHFLEVPAQSWMRRRWLHHR